MDSIFKLNPLPPLHPLHHYVYKITHTPDEKQYIGVRSCNILPIKDLGEYYFSSSSNKDFIGDQKRNPRDYQYRIIGEFTTRLLASGFEIWCHNHYDVAANIMFYNRCKATANFNACACRNTRIIYQRNKKTNVIIKKWNSIIEVEKSLGIDHSNIVHCARGRRPSAGGFIWTYEE